MKLLVTHNGVFHGDDVCAYTILNFLFPNNKLIRTRNEEIISKADIVWDVGYVYDPDNDKFDHHQPNCKEKFNNKSKVIMSSVGMIYKKYGRDFIQKLITERNNSSDLEINNNLLDYLFFKFYNNVIMEIDALDNREKQFNITNLNSEEVNDNYNFNYNYYINTNITSTVQKMNSDINLYDNSDQQDRLFKEASDLSFVIFKIHFYSLLDSVKKKDHEYNVIKEAFQNRSDERILVYEKYCHNWRKCLYELEKIFNTEIYFIIYSDNSGWYVRTVYKFENNEHSIRKNLDKNLITEDDLIFIHHNLFICKFKTRKSAINYARRLCNTN